MHAPRLQVWASHGSTLADELARVGHAVTVDAPVAEAANNDLLLIDGNDPSHTPALITALEPHVRHGQMVLHTLLGEGVQLLDPLEVHGAVVMAAHHIFDDIWVTAAADELGDATVSLLISEIGGSPIPVHDAQRPVLMAAQRLRALEYEVRLDAYKLLRGEIPGIEVKADEFLYGAERPYLYPQSPEAIETMRSAIADPEARELYEGLERRAGRRR
ncbi:hypothetical protein [Corynebacterium urinipleomorphum]|uniref:hypothetical protein n=1 Tax=Corynebacterium urinipleomorphum TaxID=1852380 RepID=UPI000B35D51D|nr:hypothetical protein [Corynebacterium urinipleomorphum]